MRRVLILMICINFGGFSQAQKKNISLEDIYKKGTFRAKYLSGIRSMKNGNEYTIMNYGKGFTTIDLYSYKTFSKIKTILNTKDFKEFKYFRNYSFSADEKLVLLSTEVENIYRHSKRAKYYIYNIATKKLSLLSTEKQMVPSFSPDGSKIAFVRKNNIFIKDLKTNKETQITKDGKKNHIINGLSDWVYEEEFTIVKMFEWSPIGNKIAFVKFDESRVKQFSMDIQGKNLYPTQMVFKYPKAGEENSKVSLHFYDLKTKITSKVNLSEYNDFYIPRLYWTKKENTLCAFIMNRHQNKLDFLFINSKNNKKRIIYTDTDKRYIELQIAPVFLKNNSFVWLSEKDGWNHLYLIDKNGNKKTQITKGKWEVTSFYGYDKKSKKIYYQSTEDTDGNKGINRNIYAVDITGKNKIKLSNKKGFNNANFSKSYKYFINTYENINTPYIYTLRNAKGKILKTIKDNTELQNKVATYNISKKEISTIHINGNDLNMYIIKPNNFDKSKKYPVLMYQYSGPGSQNVANKWNSGNDYWHQMLVQQGYIIICVDGRGTGYKGRDFKKVTYMNLVKHETEDQIAVAKKIGKLPFVNPNRIGIWGWSFGGHMSTNCILKGNDIFAMAIAVAPVTTWRFYDSIYTERYMRTPKENPKGYDENSPINYPEMLKGKYLLIHGSGDDNVHMQNAMHMAEALIQANKQFEWAIYPDKNHGIYGGNTRLHLYTKMTNFIKENL